MNDPPDPPELKVHMCNHCYLITSNDSGKTRHILFDMAMRETSTLSGNIPDGLSPELQKLLKTFAFVCEKGATKLVKEAGVDPSELESTIFRYVYLSRSYFY